MQKSPKTPWSMTDPLSFSAMPIPALATTPMELTMAFKKKKEKLTSRSWKATGVPSFKIFALNEDWKWSS